MVRMAEENDRKKKHSLQICLFYLLLKNEKIFFLYNLIVG